MGWTMSSKLKQAIERLGAVVDKLEVASSQSPVQEASSAPSSEIKAEIVKIRGLVDDAMALIAKSDKGAG